MKDKLFGKTLSELSLVVKEMGLPAFRARQIASWLYDKKVDSVDEMNNLSKKDRESLKERFDLGLFPPVKCAESSDGTKKYLFKTEAGNFIETAYIPEAKRHTLCVSSQVGCKMGCHFCMTEKQGFQGNLTALEILNQIRSIPEVNDISNMVFMGMGEPMDNLDEVLKALEVLTSDWGFGLSPSKITVSTVGLIKGIKRFLKESECHLALSLHNPIPEERKEFMPVERANALIEVLQVIQEAGLEKKRRFSVEYILFKGKNDSDRHVKQLVKILHGHRVRVNLIPFHAIPGDEFTGADYQSMVEFRDKLNKKGIRTTIRTSRGQDIDAACGLLSTKELNRDTAL